MDASNQNWVKRVVYMVRPDIVVFAAGNNSLTWTEEHQKDAQKIHTDGGGVVSSAAEIFQPKFIYVSNCFVYDGQGGNYHPTDTVIPMAILGKVKVGGENAVRGRSLNYVVIRSSPFLGRGNGISLSFMDMLRMRLDRGQRVELASNETHSFVTLEGLVEVIALAAESGVRKRAIHYGGLTRASYFELGRSFAKRFGYDASLIIEKKNDETTDYSLNSSQAIELLNIKPLLLEESLDLIQQKLVPPA
jgi:dTDP-4-dehydrorhamnose reductase